MKPYNEKLGADEQISAEETIAAFLFAYSGHANATLDEDDCAEASRQILYLVLDKFRPDLIK